VYPTARRASQGVKVLFHSLENANECPLLNQESSGFKERAASAYLVVQREVLDWREDGLPRLCAQPDDLEVGGADLLRQLVHSHVAGRTHQNLRYATGGLRRPDRVGL
jgi:hypothetical protein